MATRISQEFDRKIFREDEKRKWFTGFNLRQITKGDEKTIAEIESIELRSGTLLINEVRKDKNRPEVEGGDKPYVNSATVPLEDAGKKMNGVEKVEDGV